MAASATILSQMPNEHGEFEFTDADYKQIARIVLQEAGIELGSGKSRLVYARLAKRVRRRNLKSFRQYCELVRSDMAERTEMIEALTTNTTSFFREKHHFEHLRETALPPMLQAARSGAAIRIWSSAASSGQEPYSIALTILAADPDAGDLDIKVLATDISAHMIERGSAGIYSQEELANVEPRQLSRYFRTRGNGGEYVAGEELKRLIAFRTLNLHGDWPMRRPFDAIFCRNVMIYFDAPTQARLLARLADRLAPGGFLYIGHSERVTGEAAAQLQQTAVTTFQKPAGTRQA